MEVYQYFRLSKSKTKEIISEVKVTVEPCRSIATKYTIPRNEQELITKAIVKHITASTLTSFSDSLQLHLKRCISFELMRYTA